MKWTLDRLRKQAIGSSLFTPTTLRRAINRLGFVQADPIRSPARAQDLILRHRIPGYRAGDLEDQYPSLSLEEDYLYAYGFMPLSTWELLHPRLEGKLTRAERQVLDLVSAHKKIHPRDLESHLGREREINAWGGYSASTTRLLQALHARGFLRIAGRRKGIRVYEPSARQRGIFEPAERLRRLAMLIAAILSPISESSLRAVLRQVPRAVHVLRGGQSVLASLLSSGELESAVVNEVPYVWPAGRSAIRKMEERVRFLAPFDPLVWDRRRFEHFWGWRYRFEAYTPGPKRKLGYYAMPMLWRGEIPGWVNISNRKGNLVVEPGFVNKAPTDAVYRREFEAEVERFRHFLTGVGAA